MPRTSKLINPHVLGYKQSTDPISAYAASSALRHTNSKVKIIYLLKINKFQKAPTNTQDSHKRESALTYSEYLWKSNSNSSTSTLPSLSSNNEIVYAGSTMVSSQIPSMTTLTTFKENCIRKSTQSEICIQLDGSSISGPLTGHLRFS